MTLPDPLVRPLLRPIEILGLHPDLKRTAVYEAIRRGELPSIRLGGRLYLPTARVLDVLGLSALRSEAGPASPACASCRDNAHGLDNIAESGPSYGGSGDSVAA